MTVHDTTYFISNPVFGSDDPLKWVNSYHFLDHKRDPNYSQEEIETVLNKVNENIIFNSRECSSDMLHSPDGIYASP